MHPRAAEEILLLCKRRSKAGDLAGIGEIAPDLLEDTILELGRQRDQATTNALHNLAEAVKKFAPDLGQQLVERWMGALARQDAALDEFLAAISPQKEQRP